MLAKHHEDTTWENKKWGQDMTWHGMKWHDVDNYKGIKPFIWLKNMTIFKNAHNAKKNFEQYPLASALGINLEYSYYDVKKN